MFRIFLLFITALIGSQSAFASMTIIGTRVIFPGGEKEANIRTTNKGTLPSLVQVWVDDGNANADLNKMKIPFIVSPPIYRVEPNKGQSVRLIYSGMALPQDRETVYWFNMLEIPPKAANAGSQKLEIAFRTRIKIFYRPAALRNGNSIASFDKVKWTQVSDSLHGKGIKVQNPTPYYISFDSISAVADNRKIEIESNMLAPRTERTYFPLDRKLKVATYSSIDAKLVNDYGAVLEKKFKANGENFVTD